MIVFCLNILQVSNKNQTSSPSKQDSPNTFAFVIVHVMVAAAVVIVVVIVEMLIVFSTDVIL